MSRFSVRPESPSTAHHSSSDFPVLSTRFRTMAASISSGFMDQPHMSIMILIKLPTNRNPTTTSMKTIFSLTASITPLINAEYAHSTQSPQANINANCATSKTPFAISSANFNSFFHDEYSVRCLSREASLRAVFEISHSSKIAPSSSGLKSD